MTEKRFVAIGVEWTDGFIQDHIGDRDLFNVGAVCNLLNELSEENEKLKKSISEYAFISDCSVQVLNEEEDVKEDYLALSCKELHKLKKENEQLKSTLHYLLNVIQNKCSKYYPKCKEIVRNCFENDFNNTENDSTNSRNERK